MAESEPSQQEVVDAIYAFAANLMHDGTPPSEIRRKLVEQGLSEEAAATVVANLRQARAEAIRDAGKKNMIYGALWCVGGLVVTALTYSMAEGGGRFVLAWGAILFGGIQFVRGLMQSSDADGG